MEISLYRSDIQDKIKDVELITAGNASDKEIICKELIEYAEERRDSALTGFSYYKKAYCSYLQNDIPSFYLAILNCVKPLELVREWECLSNVYNLFGIMSENRGNIAAALDYFYKAHDYALEYNLGEVMCQTDINLGNLFLAAKNTDGAIAHFEKALKYLVNHMGMPGYVDKLTAVLVGRGRAYLQNGNLDEAKSIKDEIGAKCIAFLKGAPLLSVNCFGARLHYEAGETESFSKFLGVIASEINPSIPVMDIFEDVYELLNVLGEAKLSDAFLKIYEPVLLAVKNTAIKNLEKRLITLKLKLLKNEGKTEEYRVLAESLAEVLEGMETENALIFSNAISHQQTLSDLRKELGRIKKENESLSDRLEEEPVTGLDNRIKLRRMAEEIFNRSVLNKVGFATEFLDIDYFKTYSDNFGRDEADRCLRNIADVIREVLKNHNGVYAFHLGSDEFVLLYDGYSEQDAFNAAKDLKNEVLEKHISNEFSEDELKQITISQGLYWGMPGENDSVWEYLAEAEKLLGKVKRKSKNSTMLGKHKPTEEGQAKKIDFKKPYLYRDEVKE